MKKATIPKTDKTESKWLDDFYNHKTPPLKIFWWSMCGFFEWFYPKYRYRDIKHFIQRGRRGYADCDVWSLDSYLCDWLPKALKDLRNLKASYPASMSSVEEWAKKIRIMEKGFESARKLGDADFMVMYKRKENGHPLFRYDKARQARYEHDFKEGMKLFVKHFDGLWD